MGGELADSDGVALLVATVLRLLKRDLARGVPAAWFFLHSGEFAGLCDLCGADPRAVWSRLRGCWEEDVYPRHRRVPRDVMEGLVDEWNALLETHGHVSLARLFRAAPGYEHALADRGYRTGVWDHVLRGNQNAAGGSVDRPDGRGRPRPAGADRATA